MEALLSFNLKPAIIVGEIDHRQLLTLAMAGIGQGASAADDLLDEMERASVVPEAKVPSEVVRMGSIVTYRPDNAPERTVTLVYPVDADISAGRISVLTPIGTALIGLNRGQSISWTARDSRRHALTVLEVAQPDGEDPRPLAA